MWKVKMYLLLRANAKAAGYPFQSTMYAVALSVSADEMLRGMIAWKEIYESGGRG
jgi:hypothetical protein